MADTNPGTSKQGTSGNSGNSGAHASANENKPVASSAQATKPAEQASKPAAKSNTQASGSKSSAAKKTAKRSGPSKRKASSRKPSKPSAKRSSNASSASARRSNATQRPQSQSGASRNSQQSGNRQPDRASAQVVRQSAEQIRGFMDRSATGARETQEKVLAMGRDSAQQFARAAGSTSEQLNEALAMNRDSVQAAVTYGSIASNAAREMASEWFNQTNEGFTDQVEISKDFFNCRTLNDVMDVHSRLVRSQLDHFFDSTLKLSELMFQYTSEATEPMNEQLNQVSARMRRDAA